MNKELTIKETVKYCLVYLIIIVLSSSSNLAYSEGLANQLHWTYAAFLFSLSSCVFIVFLDEPTVKFIYNLRREEVPNVDKKRWSKLNSKEIEIILIYATISVIGFSIMLPFMINKNSAIYFVLVGSSLVRLGTLLLARIIFGDKIKDKPIFFLSFLLCLFAVIFFRYSRAINFQLWIYSIMWAIIIIIIEQAARYFTVPDIEREYKIKRYENIVFPRATFFGTTELLKTLIFLLFLLYTEMVDKLKVQLEWKSFLTIIWIGLLGGLIGTSISQLFRNKIGDVYGSIIQSLKVPLTFFVVAPIMTCIYHYKDFAKTWAETWTIPHIITSLFIVVCVVFSSIAAIGFENFKSELMMNKTK